MGTIIKNITGRIRCMLQHHKWEPLWSEENPVSDLKCTSCNLYQGFIQNRAAQFYRLQPHLQKTPWNQTYITKVTYGKTSQ